MNQHKRKYAIAFAKKTLLWALIVLLALPQLSPASAETTRNWTTYGKPGMASNERIGAFSAPYGVAVDAIGNVYVADTDNHRIQKRDATTGEWTVLSINAGQPGTGLGEFNRPHAVTVDAAGSLYVADTYNNRIQKLDMTGGFPGQWKTLGEPSGLKHPKGLTLDALGNVYVADTDNNRVRKLDAATESWTDYESISFPRGVAIDGDGNVYATSSNRNEIRKLNATGQWDPMWGGRGAAPGQLYSPSSIVFDRDGNLYVTDTGNNRVQKRDAATGNWSEWKRGGGGAGKALGEFDVPFGLAVDGTGTIYVADANNHRIQKWDAAAGIWSEWGYIGTIPGRNLGEFSYPTGVAADSLGRVFVTDYDTHRVQMLGLATGVWREWGKSGGEAGSLPGEFYNPTGVAVDAAGNVYVADRDNHRIQKLDFSQGASGVWSVLAQGRGSAPGQFEFPNDIAIDHEGNVYVADINNFRIQKLDVSSGQWQVLGYGKGNGPGEFDYPSGVAVDGDGNLYVADTDNHRIQKMNVSLLENPPSDWQPGDEWEVVGYGEGNGLGQFSEPFDVSLDGRGNVFVADLGNHRIQMLDASNGTWRQWGKADGQPGSNPGEFSSPTGLSVSGSGDIFIADYANHRLQKWTYDRPDAPTNVSATAGNGEATVSFSAPANDGGSIVTDYIVTANPGGATVSGSGSPLKVSGLTNGTSYTFTVVAVNSYGSSLPSKASNAVTPRGTTSGGGGGYVPSSPEPASSSEDVAVYVNGKQEKAGVLKLTQENGRTIATIAVDGKKLEEKLAAEGGSPEVAIRAPGGSDMAIGRFQWDLLEKMASREAVMVLQTDKAEFRIPTGRIDLRSIKERLGASAAVSEIQIEIVSGTAEAPKEAAASIVAAPMIFTLRAVYNGHTIEIPALQAYSERWIAIPNGVNPERVTTGAEVQADGTLRHLPTMLVRREGKLYARVNSLSNGTVALVWNPVSFTDVERHWAKPAVNDMGSRLVVNGGSSASYSPDQSISRAEFAAILVRGLGLSPDGQKAPFGDIDSASWYADEIGSAFKHGLINGFTDDTFRPQERLTREQAIAILARAMKLTELKEKASPTQGPAVDAFTDASAVSSWAEDSMIDGLNYGLISGQGGNRLAPKASVTRAEVAVMVRNLLVKSGLINS
ncbi:S-layer homology domain-containing protein [Cohnella boryungensis]|uniref:S-layer homology domain-containing protein n=1 Tax=Cohnella boryungensis TaxID=768479 RepID=A0ABV8SHM8_9BACL